MKKILIVITLMANLASVVALAQALPPSQNEAPRAGTPQAGVEVMLEQAAGTFVKTARTDADGKFVFTDLRPGSYRLKAGSAILSPRDAATGQASGKSAQAATQEVKSPRDAATGQATGRRNAQTEPENDGTSNNASNNGEANRTINTSRSNIKNRTVAAEIILGDDDDPPTPPSAKAGVSTSRSNVRNKQSLNAPAETEEVLAIQVFSEASANQKRTFVVPHVLEKSGLVIEVGANGQVVGRLLKTKHDTAKNAIGNIR